jgi:hypothetical protein
MLSDILFSHQRALTYLSEPFLTHFPRDASFCWGLSERCKEQAIYNYLFIYLFIYFWVYTFALKRSISALLHNIFFIFFGGEIL